MEGGGKLWAYVGKKWALRRQWVVHRSYAFCLALRHPSSDEDDASQPAGAKATVTALKRRSTCPHRICILFRLRRSHSRRTGKKKELCWVVRAGVQKDKWTVQPEAKTSWIAETVNIKMNLLS